MIGSLRGVVLARSADGEILIEVAGVGYRVQATAATAPGAQTNSEVFVPICHVVREDAETLYGFASFDERATFEALIGTRGVGPAMAMSMLAVHRPDDLRRVVATDDVDALCLVPGVGAKTAVRLLVELKSRLHLPEAQTPPGADPAIEELSAAERARLDVRSALGELGYDHDQINRVLAALPASEDASVLLREALRRLSG